MNLRLLKARTQRELIELNLCRALFVAKQEGNYLLNRIFSFAFLLP